MEEKINFVSLGDSIATGTLTPFSRTNSYVFYLQNTFRERGYRPDVYRMAYDGDTSGDLLWKLTHSPPFCQVIERANFITISIGGNDLLRACSIPGFKSIHIPMAKHGTARFLDNWPKIIKHIRQINPKAKIVVLNLYNPYNHTPYEGHLYELTDRFILQINAAIAAHSPSNYRIADTYTAFRQFAKGKMHRMSCLYPESVLRNPHPTPGAQRLIAGLILEQFDLLQEPPPPLHPAHSSNSKTVSF